MQEAVMCGKKEHERLWPNGRQMKSNDQFGEAKDNSLVLQIGDKKHLSEISQTLINGKPTKYCYIDLSSSCVAFRSYSYVVEQMGFTYVF
jgi:hypothetical protein